MRIFLRLALTAIITSAAIAQDARDIAREMDADTTTSVSRGSDRNDLHRDTETVEQTQQRAPDLLEAAQGRKPKKLTKAKRKELLLKRQRLLKDRQAASNAAAANAKKQIRDTAGPIAKQVSAGEETARKKAERMWDAKRGKEVKDINQLLQEGDTNVRFHAPSLVEPK